LAFGQKQVICILQEDMMCKMKNKNYWRIIYCFLIFLTMSGCYFNPNVHKLYPNAEFAELPENQIAILLIAPPIQIDIVDFTNIPQKKGGYWGDSHRFELLPGQHIIYVRYWEPTGNFRGERYSKSSIKLSFMALAGHKYRVKYSSDIKTWNAWVEDVTEMSHK